MSGLDMRLVTPGSAIDEFHFELWAGFLRFMLEREEVRAEFEAETGTQFFAPPRNAIEQMVDKACGIDREADGAAYMRRFAEWVTPRYWGGPEDLSPAIEAKLASAAGARSDETNEDSAQSEGRQSGPKGDAQSEPL